VRDKIEDRPKGFGYVEYGSLEGLVKALELAGSQLAGRNIRVSVAEPRRFFPHISLNMNNGLTPYQQRIEVMTEPLASGAAPAL